MVGTPAALPAALAIALFAVPGVPTIVLDLGAAKGSLVGESEAKIRNAFKIIDAVGGGRVYFIGTCNKVSALPPELKRRFTSGIFFFDLPTEAERILIWKIYIQKYELGCVRNEHGQIVGMNGVNDEGWTGAEIRNCCRMAYRQNISLQEASQYIVPVSKSAGKQIDELRREATGKYLAANHAGVYSAANGSRVTSAAATTSTRMFDDEEENKLCP